MTTETLSKIDLRKNMVINLKKSKGLEHQRAQVVLALDYSGSMSSHYTSGQVQDLVERILPLGLAFDDNGEVDFYLFHNSPIKMRENLTLKNIHGYINEKIMYKYNMGGTEYGPIINEIVSDFAPEKKSGWFGKKSDPLDLPVYVIFITDGETSNQAAAEKAIIESSQAGIFYQFVGIGNDNFSFLKKLDTMSNRNIDNANFFTVSDLSKKSDEDLYSLLLQEFPSFVVEARAKKLIK